MLSSVTSSLLVSALLLSRHVPDFFPHLYLPIFYENDINSSSYLGVLFSPFMLQLFSALL